MGYENITSVRQGKYFEININDNDKENVNNIAEEICKKLLANSVIENYKINLEE